VSEKMPRTILTQTYDNIPGKVQNFKYVHLKQYDLGGGVKVRLNKERASFTKDAGWGLQAVTAIPRDFVLGCFAVKTRNADKPEEGTYSIKTHTGKYIVMQADSLMNRINTIASKKHRYLCNCVIQNIKNGEVSIKTTRNIARNSMLWTKYNNREHYWNIQFYILQKRLRTVPSPDDNDNSCRTCRKRHVELYLCDSCPVAVCEPCLTQREKYLLGRDYFFCSSCLENPPRYLNRFS